MTRPVRIAPDYIEEDMMPLSVFTAHQRKDSTCRLAPSCILHYQHRASNLPVIACCQVRRLNAYGHDAVYFRPYPSLRWLYPSPSQSGSLCGHGYARRLSVETLQKVFT